MEPEVLFRNWRSRRQLKEFVATADPVTLAKEREALARENTEAPDLHNGPLLPTEVGTEVLAAPRRFFFGNAWGVPALKPSDSSFKVRGLIDPADFDQSTPPRID